MLHQLPFPSVTGALQEVSGLEHADNPYHDS
jgi:hypothetical protein